MQDPSIPLFFLKKDLRPGARMKLQFETTAPATAFVFQTLVNSTPFSSEKLVEVTSRLAMDPISAEVEMM